MKKITFLLLIIILGLYSCTKKVTFKDNGGMILTFEIDENDKTFKESIKNRINTYSKLHSYECPIEEKNNKLKITMPFFLSNIQLSNLLFSKGDLKVIKNDSLCFNLNNFKKIDLNFNVLYGEQQVTATLNNENLKHLEDLTKKSLNEKIKIQVDSTVIMSPKIRAVISNGILDIFISETKNYDSNILYSILKTPFDKTLEIKSFKKRLFLKSNDKLGEISSETFNLYNQIKDLISKNKSELLKDLRGSHNEQYIVNNDINAFLENDFEGYLAVSELKDISDLKKSFSELQNVLQKYDEKNELKDLINSINELTEYEIFELK